MKKLFLMLSCFLLHCFCFAQKDPLLMSLVDSLYDADQQVQLDLMAAIQNRTPQKNIDSIDAEKLQVFRRNIPLLKKIIAEKGLPRYSNAGKATADKFLTLVNHSFSDIPFQESVLKLCFKEIKNKNISGPAVAMMEDKMRIHSHRLQRYGTQMDYDAAGNAVVRNLYRPDTVDARRKRMGLGPLKEYIEQMTALHKEMNQK